MSDNATTTAASQAPASETGKTETQDLTASVHYEVTEQAQREQIAQTGQLWPREVTRTIPITIADLPLCGVGKDGAVSIHPNHHAEALRAAGWDHNVHATTYHPDILANIRRGREIIDEAYAAACAIASQYVLDTPDLAVECPERSGNRVYVPHEILANSPARGIIGIIGKIDNKWGSYGISTIDLSPDAQACLRDRAQEQKRAKMAEQDAAIDAFLADPKARAEVSYDRLSLKWGDIYPTHPRYELLRAEAKRRNTADEEAEKRAAESAAAAKPAFLRAWLAEHGTQDQIERFEAGLLPEPEYIRAMEDYAFSPLSPVPLYVKITRREAYDALSEEQQQLVGSGDVKVKFRAEDATEASAEEWATLKRIQSLMPDDAECKLRTHEATFDDNQIPWGIVQRNGIQVRAKLGPFSLVREYAAQ